MSSLRSGPKVAAIAGRMRSAPPQSLAICRGLVEWSDLASQSSPPRFTRLETFHLAVVCHLAAASFLRPGRSKRPDARNNSARIAVWRPRALARKVSLTLITGMAGDLARAPVGQARKGATRSSLNDCVVKIWPRSSLFWPHGACARRLGRGRSGSKQPAGVQSTWGIMQVRRVLTAVALPFRQSRWCS